MLQIVVEKYPKTKPLAWDDQETLDLVIDEILSNEVNAKASPGVPLCALASTNAKLLQDHRAFVLRAVKQRLALLASADLPSLRSMSAEDKIRHGYCDPVRLFVKKEPHNREKVKQKRFRLISSVSIIDQLVERVLHSRQNNAEINSWQTIPSKPGISLTNDESVRVFAHEAFTAHDLNPIADVDISGYDWSVQAWELVFDLECRIALAQSPTEDWVNAVRARGLCLAHAVFMFSDGLMVAQDEYGVQKSGSYNTASANSRIKVGAATLVGSTYVAACGDDAVETYVEGAVSKYKELGHPVKDYKRCDGNSISFCSSLVRRDGTWEPETWSKTFFKFLHQAHLTREQWIQFKYTLRWCPMKGRIMGYLLTAGEEELSRILNGWEQEEQEDLGFGWEEEEEK